VIEHRRKKYVCQGCKTSPQTAPMPAQPIPKSNASSGLLAYVVTSKFQDALPLYRQEAIFKRLDIHLPRNTLATWMLKLQALAQPIYNLLQDRLLTSGYIHMDETTVQVLKEPGKAASTKSYMWVRKTGDPDQQVVLFDYEPTRSAAVVDKLLGDYQGYLQTDDYKGYHAFGQRTGAELLACWAHVRRKFIEAEKVANTPKGKIGKAGMGVQLIKNSTPSNNVSNL
jgi:transposase